MTWMRILIVGLVVLAGGGLALWWNTAQKEAAFVSSQQRAMELYKAGKYVETLPAIEDYLKAAKARFGEKAKSTSPSSSSRRSYSIT